MKPSNTQMQMASVQASILPMVSSQGEFARYSSGA